MKHILIEYCEKLNNLENLITDYELKLYQKLLPYINDKLILNSQNHWIYILPHKYKFMNNEKGLFDNAPINFQIYIFKEFPIDKINLQYFIKSKNYIDNSFKKLSEIINIIRDAKAIKMIPLC